MSFTGRIVVTDRRAGMDRLFKVFDALDEHVVDAGILANPDGPGSTDADTIMIDDDKKQNKMKFTVGNIAGFHEFGFGVPERSFVRLGVDRSVLVFERMIFDEIDAMVGGRDIEVALAHVGLGVAGKMKMAIEGVWHGKLLSEQRKAEKRRIGTPMTPLINWGLMIDTLRYRVHKA
jgi:hypothetical protein